MNPTPPLTSQRFTTDRSALRRAVRRAGRGDADALVSEADLRDFRRAPDVARVDEDRRKAVSRRDEALFDFSEVRRAVAAPLGEQDERVRAVEHIVVTLLHRHLAAEVLGEVRAGLR